MFICLMDVREARVALNLIEGVGPITVRRLLQVFGDPVEILRAPQEQLVSVPGIAQEQAYRIANWQRSVDLDGELRRVQEFGCRIVIPEDEEYPALLKEIYDPPIVLYVRGRLELRDRNAIAVVGSRRASHYGLETARKFAYQLAYAGVTVVSGGARGIDTAAHQGALAAGGRTVVVLGCGINIVFPPENAELFDRVASQGAVVSEFPFNRPPDKQSFPIRNRLIAGMCLGTVVVEAPLNSGALITAAMAVDQGRQVFAVPGRIDSPGSKGCHDLIKRGAKLCESVEDILSEFEYLFPPGKLQLNSQLQPRQLVMELSEEEQKVLEAIGSEEKGLDELIRQSGLSAARAAVVLFQLELKRLVRQLPGKRFVRIRQEEGIA